jgi:hypothetical protein
MQPYSLTLTHNELLVILRLFGVESMNGLTAEPLAGLDERQIAERLNGGEATLVSRGLLQYQDDDTAILDDALLAFVGASVFPDSILLVSETRMDGTNVPVYFNATPQLMVEHISPRPGIYVFTHIPDRALLRQRVRMIVQNLLDDTPPAPGYDLALNDQTLAAVLAAVLAEVRQNNPVKAIRLLEQAAWPDDAIKAFAADLAAATIWTGVVATGLRDADQPDSQSIMVMRGATCRWLIEQQTGGDPAALRVSAAAAPACLEAFQALAGRLEQTFGA